MADWYVSSAAYAALPAFAASTAYTVGQIIKPLTVVNGQEYVYRCTTAGTSGAQPSWPLADNSTVTTGGATFTNVTGQSAYGWGAAAGTLFCIGVNVSNRPLVGDRVFLSSDHSDSYSSSSNFTWGFNSSTHAFGLIQILSVNRAGSVPPVAADILNGASITFSMGASNGMVLEAYCDMFWQGVSFVLSGAGTGSFIVFNSSGTKSHYFKNCSFDLGAGGARILGMTNCKVVLDNTSLRFGASGQIIQAFNSGGNCEIVWLNGSILGTAPTDLFFNVAIGSSLMVTCRGVDLSPVTGSLLRTNTSAQITRILLDSCKVASGVARFFSLAALQGAPSNDEIELVNCYDGANVINERWNAVGGVTTDRSTYMSGGANDDVGAYSHKLVSNVNSDFCALPLNSFWLDVENTLTGSSKTATVEIISSGALNNNDIRLLLEYMGASGNPIASFVDSLSSVLTAAAALPTSGVTWNSPPSTPQKQLLQVTFTPQRAGRVRGLVRLGKPSATVWVNPQIAIS